MTREAFDGVGGFSDIPLLEDVEFSRRLSPPGTPVCISDCVITSGRRWERHSVWGTIRLMWWSMCYFLGADPQQLALEYGDARRDHVPRQ